MVRVVATLRLRVSLQPAAERIADGEDEEWDDRLGSGALEGHVARFDEVVGQPSDDEIPVIAEAEVAEAEAAQVTVDPNGAAGGGGSDVGRVDQQPGDEPEQAGEAEDVEAVLPADGYGEPGARPRSFG